MRNNESNAFIMLSLVGIIVVAGWLLVCLSMVSGPKL
jgi:hypothetical protein